MRYLSTRGQSPAVDLSAAIRQGLAPDGGLYVPQAWPAFSVEALAPEASLEQIAAALLRHFAGDDPLAAAATAVAGDAFGFPAQVRALSSDLGILELFHGPTAAFKDFGASFLAASLSRIQGVTGPRMLILVATSGDTGGAVAAAFHGKPGIDVAVLYPKGLVSPLQERQLTCWGGNVRAFSVRGTFDDCQRIVKAAFDHGALADRFHLCSANSINIGRLVPQMTYFAQSSLQAWRQRGEKLSFVVPSGNLGHATACVWARRLGFPIGEIVLAHNANKTVLDYYETGEWRPRASVHTLASAMDVGDPSNAERLHHMYPSVESLRQALAVGAVDDDAIRARIRRGFEEYGEIWCPHTATAAEIYARRKLHGASPGPWAIVATAHPAKFAEIVEPLIGRPIAMPAALESVMERAGAATEINAELAELEAAFA